MSISTRNIAGRMMVEWRRDGAAARLARAPAALGLLLVLSPALFAPELTGRSLTGMAIGQVLLLGAAWLLLAEGSRARRVRASLHVASGELEIRRGTGLLAAGEAWGAVEVDRVRLDRPETSAFRISLLVRVGPPVTVVPAESDEPLARDAAVLVAQGMGVPLEDLRYRGAEPAAADREPSPGRVASLTRDRRQVFTWSYRDRFRPEATLLGAGAAFVVALLLPPVARAAGTAGLAAATGVVVLLSLGALAHVLTTLTVRRLTFRPDAVRLERSIFGLPLLSRVALFDELKAILVLRRGPLATLSLRTAGRSGIALPFEDPKIAAWLRHRIGRAARREPVEEAPSG